MSSGRFIHGTGIIVRKGDQVLLGERLNSHGAGSFAIPGGKVEYGESHIATAARELFEETGIDIRNSVPMELTLVPSYPPVPKEQIEVYDRDETREIVSIVDGGTICAISPRDNLHMVVRLAICDAPKDANPQVKEPLKCSGWFWAPWSEIQRLSKYQLEKTQNALSQYGEGNTNNEGEEKGEFILEDYLGGFESEIAELNNGYLFQPLVILGTSSWTPDCGELFCQYSQLPHESKK